MIHDPDIDLQNHALHDEVFMKSTMEDISNVTIYASNECQIRGGGLMDVYNHFDSLQCEEIDEIIGSEFRDSDGKLYMQVRWNDGRESTADA